MNTKNLTVFLIAVTALIFFVNLPAYASGQLVGSKGYNVQEFVQEPMPPGQYQWESNGIDAVRYWDIEKNRFRLGYLKCINITDEPWTNCRLQVNLYDENGELKRNIADLFLENFYPYGVDIEDMFGVMTNSVKLAPDGTKIWFSLAGYNTEASCSFAGQWYSVSCNSDLTVFEDPVQEFEMTGPFDIAIPEQSLETPYDVLVAGKTTVNPWEDSFSIYASNGGSLQTITEIGGFSTGIALDKEGNLWAGTNTWPFGSEEQQFLLMYTADQISAAVNGGQVLTRENAALALPIPVAINPEIGENYLPWIYDIECDPHGNLYLTANCHLEPYYDPNAGYLLFIENHGINTSTFHMEKIANIYDSYNWYGYSWLNAISYLPDGSGLLVDLNVPFGEGLDRVAFISCSSNSAKNQGNTDSSGSNGKSEADSGKKDDKDSNSKKNDGDGKDDTEKKKEESKNAGDPVNITTGNSFRKKTDIYPGPTPMALSFARYYNSRSTRLRPLGYNWSHTYDRYLDFKWGRIVAWRESGRAVYFSAFNYEPESGSKLRITKNGDNSYTLTTPGQIFETYDSSGKLVSIRELNNNTVTLRYQDGKLTSVSDPFGRTLNLCYYPSGRLSSVAGQTETYQYAYDDNNNLIQVTFPDDQTRQYIYDDSNDAHNLTGVIDENGNQFVTYAYDNLDRTILSTYAENAYRVDLVYGFEGDPDKVQVTDGRGNTTIYKRKFIHSIGLVESITGPACYICGNTDSSYTYDENTLDLLTKTDGKNITTIYSDYDAWGNACRITEASGHEQERIITKTYDPVTNRNTSITKASVLPGEYKITEFIYDTHGNLAQKIKHGFVNALPATLTTTYSYNTRGQITQINGPRTDVDDIITYTYDDAGNRLSTTRPFSNTVIYSDYDESGRVGKITDPNGLVSVLTYDSRGQVTMINTGGAVFQFEHNPDGNLKKSIGPAGTIINYFYDDAQRLSGITDNENNKIAYTLNTEGKIEIEEIFDSENTLVKTLSRTFNAYNFLEDIIHVHGTISLSYDMNGNRSEMVDQNGNPTTYSYDSLNRLKQITQPSPGSGPSPVTKYNYDIQGNLIMVTDAENHMTDYEYDDFGNLTKIISPDQGTIICSYDKAGNLTEKTNAKGILISYTYDAQNRLTGICYPDSSQNKIFSYDGGESGKGRLTGMTDPGGIYTYAYDIQGNLIQENKTIDDHTYTTKYTYDNARRLISITYPDTLIIKYDRDNAGKITEVSLIRNGITSTVASDIKYLPFGPVKELTFGNQLKTEKQFDTAYLLASIKAGSIRDLSYNYYSSENIQAITDNLDAGRNQNFEYDALSRLTGAAGNFGTVNYTYDLIGNRLSRAINGVSETYTYKEGTNMLAAVTGTESIAFSYDETGNTTSKGNTSFEYNQAERIKKIFVDGSLSSAYTYNSMGQRVKKVSGSSTTIYHYDLWGNLIAESDENSEHVTNYVYLEHERLAAVRWEPDDSPICLADMNGDGCVGPADFNLFRTEWGRCDCSINTPCKADLNSDGCVGPADFNLFRAEWGQCNCPLQKIYYYHNDHLGTPHLMTNQAGTVVWSADSLPFGKTIITQNAVDNDFRFPGQYFDAETSLHYNYHRYYDPEIGRYLRPDPIGLAGGINLYSYCLNDPVNLVDMSGLYVKHWWEDKLPPWLRDNRPDFEREREHQKYNESLKDRLEKIYPFFLWFDPPSWSFHYYNHCKSH